MELILPVLKRFTCSEIIDNIKECKLITKNELSFIKEDTLHKHSLIEKIYLILKVSNVFIYLCMTFIVVH